MSNMPILDEQEEKELIIGAKAGNVFALDDLARRYEPLLWSLARRLTFCRFVSEELVQAGYVGLLSAVKKYDSKKQAKLKTYAVPWILGEMRAVLREKYDVYHCTSLDAQINQEECTLHETLIGTEEIGLEAMNLRLEVEKLSSEEQSVIILRYARDRTQKETALLLGKSQSQVSRLERSALDRLKENLL